MQSTFWESYSYVGDVSVMALCLLMFGLVMTSYVSKNLGFRLFLGILGSLLIAALVNVGFNCMMKAGNPACFRAIAGMRLAYHAILYGVFFMFALYVLEVTGINAHSRRIAAAVAGVLAGAMILAEMITVLSGNAYTVTEYGVFPRGVDFFMIGYVLFCTFHILLMLNVKHRLYKRVMNGFFVSVGVAFLVMGLQQVFGRSSFTTITFLFPVVAMMYIMHSNPFNAALGAVDSRAMQDMVRYMHAHNKPFIYLSLFLSEFNGEGKMLPENVQAVVRRFTADYFRSCVLFQIGNGHLVLLVPKSRNHDYEQRIQNILAGFHQQYQRLHYDYKIVIGESMEEISRKNEYASLIRNIHREIPENTVHRVSPEDILRFNRSEYILRELADICSRNDPDDPRVLAYCQPVYNIGTGRFDTAEALMRLQLDEAGMVYPDQFIPLAEEHGYIHALTEIILNKTCREIRRICAEGYELRRISVNVSVLELKEAGFCADISRVIDDNLLEGDKIAIELTESRSEADFMVVKEKIEELRGRGIKFYLDDFGTGYSNMERIMELPFDIIKFDRSLVLASGADERSEKIVENLANMFRDMNYSVLYEGVEDESDEARCRGMSASYLQGYKYSRPVPIERLREFLPKISG